jgi:hypothetical protein
MPDKNFKVTAYAGYRGEEDPRSFVVDGEEVIVVQIMDRWVEEKEQSREQKRFFTIKASDGSVHTLYYDPVLMEWFYWGSKRDRETRILE